jgi:cullin-associated NEDD8-dissociated protein 1
MAKSIGNKLAPYLQAIIPVLQSLMMQLDENSPEDDANELSEACLSTIATIIRRCARSVSPFVDSLLENSFTLISYDPNYLYNDDEDEEMKDDDDDEGWGSDVEPDSEDMGDDEDSSWKVRRGAINVIESVIKTRPDLLN